MDKDHEKKRDNTRPTIGLGLIVKNESADLPACLESFLPSINVCVIVDTGSTDNTLEIARAKLEESGRRHEIITYLDSNDSDGRLCDFSAARNQYVRSLEKYNVDYVMSCDADDTLVTPDIRGALANNPADFYGVKYRMNDNFWFNSYKIWRNKIGAKYDGRVHECLHVDWTKKIVDLDNIEFLHHWTTIEGQESGSERNMRILRSEIYPSLRSIFYWANENVDSGNHDEAIKWYLEYIRRAKTENNWFIELAHCYFRAARWLQARGDTEHAITLSKELLAMDSSWSESWCELAHIARCQGDWDLMREYCVKAMSNEFKPRLFSEVDKYTFTPANMLEVAKLMQQMQGKKNAG